jgi:two-component system response regulator QseB
MRILLVEDEKLIADAIKVSLGRAGYHVDWASDGDSAEEALATSDFDLIILDLGLPGQDGLSLLKHIRRQGRSEPVIILTARDAVENRIEGLDYGADDYMTKPFDMDELLARARVQIRRANGRSRPVLSMRGVTLDPAAHTVTLNDAPVELAPLAFQVLSILMERKGRVVTKDDLASCLYGWEEGAESNTVEVYVSQIRRRLDSGLIRTIRGIGYIIDKD